MTGLRAALAALRGRPRRPPRLDCPGCGADLRRVGRRASSWLDGVLPGQAWRCPCGTLSRWHTPSGRGGPRMLAATRVRVHREWD